MPGEAPCEVYQGLHSLLIPSSIVIAGIVDMGGTSQPPKIHGAQPLYGLIWPARIPAAITSFH